MIMVVISDINIRRNMHVHNVVYLRCSLNQKVYVKPRAVYISYTRHTGHARIALREDSARRIAITFLEDNDHK